MKRIGSGGLDLSTAEWRGSGLPLLLVHGFSHNHHVWDHVAPAFDDRLRPIAFDLRGHGESGWSIDGDYGVDAHAGDLACVLDGFGIERAIVVGHSLGGNASTLLAAAEPDRVEALVLVDTGPSLSFDAMLRLAGDASGTLRSYASVDDFHEVLSGTYLLGDPEVVRHMASTSLFERFDRRLEPRIDPALLLGRAKRRDLEQMEARLWAALAEVRCPTLLVRGAASAMLGEEAALRMTRSCLRDATLVTLPRTGHAVMVDDGPGLVREIEAFVAKRVAGYGLPARA